MNLKQLITNHRRLVLLSAISVVALVAVLLLWLRNRPQTVMPKRGTITEAVYALGTVKSEFVFKIKAALPMAIKTVAIKEGDKVQKGQTLLVSDSGTTFRAPFAGTVTSLTVNTGELVITGMQLLVLQDLDRLYLEYSLEQESALLVRPGQKAELTFETLRAPPSHGIVDRIYPNEGQFIVRVIVKDLPPAVLPEMTADTAIEVASKKNVVMIPMTAVKNNTVTRLRNGKRTVVKVQLGTINNEWAE
ncbi:MAG: efflux RND transporter periplasmic adaptor subunit, partial [Leptonema sp. (in: Bacteria)]|nr:efflux RND transporter periplasmic adaptor subunit [Leptonema sp. (in: bacteria)]